MIVQDLILALKADNVEACFILCGISFHRMGSKLDIVSLSKCAICTFLLANCTPLLKLYLLFSWKLKTSLIIIGESPLLTLKISVAKYCRFFIWTETDLSFCNNSWKLFFCLDILFLEPYDVYCWFYYLKFYHDISRLMDSNWKVKNVLNKIHFLVGDAYCNILDKACSFY